MSLHTLAIPSDPQTMKFIPVTSQDTHAKKTLATKGPHPMLIAGEIQTGNKLFRYYPFVAGRLLETGLHFTLRNW